MSDSIEIGDFVAGRSNEKIGTVVETSLHGRYVVEWWAREWNTYPGRRDLTVWVPQRPRRCQIQPASLARI